MTHTSTEQPIKNPPLVQIEWRDDGSDWPWFWLLGTNGEWLHHRLAAYNLAARQREMQLLGEIEALERLALNVLKQLGVEATTPNAPLYHPREVAFSAHGITQEKQG